MRLVYLAAFAGVLGLSACVSTTPEGETEQVSEQVRELAAPGQDLSQVRLESDGCYWYQSSFSRRYKLY